MAANFDRYRLQYQPEWKMADEIGRGGFGVVYKEQIRRPGMFRSELCAVKKVPLGIVDLAGDLQRYKREIGILASLVHREWFVQFVGWCETEHVVFIAMEYMELGDLGRHLGAPWSESDTRIVAEQLLQGLSVLHEAGIAHRDLKPQNVFPILLENGRLRIKIGDFGVSKSVTPDSNTGLRTLISALGYTAPEMIGHPDSYTNAVDLWSLGCLVYRMMCGEDLFRSLEDIYRYKFNAITFPRASLIARGVSQSGVDFMESLLHGGPQYRPAAADALCCSWIGPEPLEYTLSSRQVERLQSRPPGDSIRGNAETIPPQFASPLGPETSCLGHSSPFRTEGSESVVAKYPDTASIYYRGKLRDPSMISCQATLKGHKDLIRSVAFSPDGERLASGSFDSTIMVWDPSTGACQATMTGHTRWVTSVAFSLDGECLASGSWDGNVRLWNPSTTACQAILNDGSYWVSSVAFSPDGKRLASASGSSSIKLWDLSTGACEATLKQDTGAVHAVQFSPDGKCLASGSNDHTVRLWDLFTGTCQATLEGHSLSVNSVGFSPDGRRLGSGSYDETVKLWDLRTNVCQATLEGHSDWVKSIAFSPDGKCLASASDDQTVKLWDPSTEACHATLKGHYRRVNSVAFSPDGKRLASGSTDNNIKLWRQMSKASEETP